MSEHGTERRYAFYKCRCDACRAAGNAARMRRYYGKGPGKTPPGLQVHGLNGYLHHKCRCNICRAANAKSQREYQARKRAAA